MNCYLGFGLMNETQDGVSPCIGEVMSELTSGCVQSDTCARLVEALVKAHLTLCRLQVSCAIPWCHQALASDS
jgi:hypothetical protein